MLIICASKLLMSQWVGLCSYGAKTFNFLMGRIPSGQTIVVVVEISGQTPMNNVKWVNFTLLQCLGSSFKLILI